MHILKNIKHYANFLFHFALSGPPKKLIFAESHQNLLSVKDLQAFSSRVNGLEYLFNYLIRYTTKESAST